jgi:tRNA U34 5-methylaminomethyl-2-thiouridine-forming methyltransferase MnmC
MPENNYFLPEKTADGSFTFFSPEFGECFHSHQGAKLEAQLKFVEPLQLRLKARQPSLRLLDVCYGLGYNTAASLSAIWEVNPHCRVEWIGLELNPEVPKAAIAHELLNNWPSPIPELLSIFATKHYYQSDRLVAQLYIGEARETLAQVYQQGFQADAILLDPFSPPVCPQLWTVEFLGLLAKCLKPEGLLATYSCSAAVRTALLTAGLEIGPTQPVGRRSPGTLASFTRANLEKLSLQEEEHLQTKAAIPYRDPDLRDRAEVIIQRRQQEQLSSPLESSSQWKKRWLKA